jgi:hypothetical protein
MLRYMIFYRRYYHIFKFSHCLCKYYMIFYWSLFCNFKFSHCLCECYMISHCLCECYMIFFWSYLSNTIFSNSHIIYVNITWYSIEVCFITSSSHIVYVNVTLYSNFKFSRALFMYLLHDSLRKLLPYFQVLTLFV